MIRVSAATLGLIFALLIAGWPSAGGSGLLINGGFEEGSVGWNVNAGVLDAVTDPVHTGARAGQFSGSGQPTTQFAYQWSYVQPGQSYELSGWIAALGTTVSRAFLRISWVDANGQLLSSEDSSWLSQPDGTFHLLTTGGRVSPTAAKQARVSALVLADSPFTVHLDDFSFTGPAANPSTPTPAPVLTPPPAPPTATPVRMPTPVPTRTPTGAPAAPTTPAEEPDYFPDLVNGGFEQLRPDGTPYGWRKQGGEMTTVLDPRTEGLRALALASSTSSTKWAYQTVSVREGAYYEASVQALAGPGLESALLRLSWYASPDGSGQAVSSVDSLESTLPTAGAFRLITTGAVQAPAGVASAKLRLMLRPASEQHTAAYFDAAAFYPAQPDPSAAVSRQGTASSARGRAASRQEAGDEASAVLTGDISAGGSTPVRLANVKPARDAEPSRSSSGGQGGEDWAVFLSLAVALAAICIAGGYELWQRRTAVRHGHSDEP